MPITCLITDSHPAFRDYLRGVLESEPGLAVVGEAANASEAIRKVGELSPDILLMDIGASGSAAFEAARDIARENPGTRLIFLTTSENEEYMLRSLEIGASGYLSKDAPAARLVSAVREVFQGRKYVSPQILGRLVDDYRERSRNIHGISRGSMLTPREREVIRMIAEGHSVREIAGLLSLSIKTVEAHKFNLMRKLNIHNKAQLVTYAIQKKLVQIPAAGA